MDIIRNVTLQTCNDTISRAIERGVNQIDKQMPRDNRVDEISNLTSLNHVFDELFRGSINIGRILCALSLCRKLVNKLDTEELIGMVEKYFNDANINKWLAANGGWNMYKDMFPYEPTVLETFVSWALLGTLVTGIIYFTPT